MTSADVQQLQYALSKAQERNEELAALLKASNASNDALVEMVLKDEATIARMSAENKRIKPLRDMLELVSEYAFDNVNSLSLRLMNDLCDTLESDDEAQQATVTEVTP
jgi:hypothetical protein